VIEVAERDDLLRQLEQVPSSMTEGGASSTQLSMFNLNNVSGGRAVWCDVYVQQVDEGWNHGAED
jgi:hypothetical protein